MDRFVAEVAREDDGREGYMQHYVAVPERVVQGWLKTRKRRSAKGLRVRGSLDQTPFERAVQALPDGTIVLRFGAGWLRDAGLAVGDEVTVEVEPDPEPDRVLVPPELEAALRAEPELAVAWAMLTPGRRRTLVYPVTRAKRPATKAKRVEELLTAVRADVVARTEA